ncbi:MAG: hypothetical protein HZY79_03565 [Rhodoblastus sp.]|nr:MAG: hypothetical protein HZY79_03565 [Rhodoblastus sp.]
MKSGSHRRTLVAALALGLFALDATLVACAAAPAAKTEIEEIAPGLFRSWETLPSDWSLLRFTRDKDARALVGCDAVKLTGSETGLRLSVDKATGAVVPAIMGPGTGLTAKPVTVTYWLGADKSGARAVEARIVKSLDDMEWLSAAPSGETGLQDKLRGAARISFVYPDQGKARTLVIPLAGAKAALEKLLACARSM